MVITLGKMLAKDRPPQIDVSLSWRDLYLDGAFAQRELTGDGPLSRQANERLVRLGVGQAPLEDLDLEGALQPIAFADGGYWTGFELPAIPVADLTFREQREPLAWKENYAWDGHGYPTVSPLYSPWQLLYLDDVVTEAKAELGLDVLLLSVEERERGLDSIRGFYELQERDFRQIDESWRGLIKVLVALQNHYWPQISGRVALLPDRQGESDWVEAGRDGLAFEPEGALEKLGCGADQLSNAYRFLVMRGFDREPRDGLAMLRRARPRPFHVRWRGAPRRAQDNFDAAEVLRLFLLDVGGEVSPPEAELMDGRQAERTALFAHGPAASVDRKKLKAELSAAELYPHGVEAIVEGPSEIRIIEAIVGALLGSVALAEISYFDLEGVGAAKQVMPLATSLGAYAVRTLIVVDQEGQMGSYIKRMIDVGTVESEDVCLWREDLEADNSSPAELIELAAELLAAPEDGIEPVQLTISVNELVAAHVKRNQGRPSTKQTGLAEALVSEIEAHDPPARLPKPALAEALGVRIVGEFEACAGDEERLAELYRRRPILGFVTDRLIAAINRPISLA
jgi:hypothetical protein